MAKKRHAADDKSSQVNTPHVGAVGVFVGLHSLYR